MEAHLQQRHTEHQPPVESQPALWLASLTKRPVIIAVKGIIVLDLNTFLLSLSGVLEPTVWSTQTALKFKAHLLVLLVGSITAGKISRVQKSIWIQNNYVF